MPGTDPGGVAQRLPAGWGRVCTPGRCPGWGRGAAKGSPLLPGRMCLWCAGVCHRSPSPISPCPGWIQPHAPSSAHSWVAEWVSAGTVGRTAAPRQEANYRVSEGKGLPLLFKRSRPRPSPPFLGLGVNRGIVLVLDEVININYANQPLPAHPYLPGIPGGRETAAKSIYSLRRSLPLRTALSKESCNESRSSRAEFASLRYDKIF